ncbi:hypothetical protein ACVWZV_007772 [Bradyrhizobium sp. GM5.1]
MPSACIALDDRIDAAGDVLDEVEADADADDDGRAEDDRDQHEGIVVAVGGILRGLVSALGVELDVLGQDRVGLKADLVDRLGVQLLGLMRNLAGLLARERHDNFGALLVVLPERGPIVVELPFLRRGDHRLVGLAEFGIGLDHGRERLFHRELLVQRFRQHVLSNDVAVSDHAGTQVAEHAHAGHPARGDVDGVGIHRPHLHDGEQAHAGHRDQQERHDTDDLGTNGNGGEHNRSLCVGAAASGTFTNQPKGAEPTSNTRAPEQMLTTTPYEYEARNK